MYLAKQRFIILGRWHFGNRASVDGKKTSSIKVDGTVENRNIGISLIQTFVTHSI